MKSYLENNNLKNAEQKRTEEIYLTKPEDEFKEIAKNIMGVNIKLSKIVDM